MSQITPDIAEQVVAACQANLEEVAGALSRALDGQFELTVGEPDTIGGSALPDDLKGPGLVIVLTFDGAGAVAVLPESSALVPAWCAAPDPTGESKLATLAQELGMLLMPDEFMADDFGAARVENAHDALSAGGVAESAAIVPIWATCGDKSGTLSFIWPLSSPGKVLPTAASDEPAPASTSSAPPDPSPPVVSSGNRNPPRAGGFRRLPKYSRSLLKIKVPVVVHLAAKKQAVSEILELGPGSIIKFNKSCDESLDMCIGDRKIAEGEAVKVGENFGVRISTIALPEERFRPVKRPAG